MNALFRSLVLYFDGRRSPNWRRVRAEHLKAHPACAACGVKSDLEVHHLRPFHLFVELECDPENLLTLCQRCHLLIGHLGDWQAWNPLARVDAARLLAEVLVRPYKRAG